MCSNPSKKFMIARNLNQLCENIGNILIFVLGEKTATNLEQNSLGWRSLVSIVRLACVSL